MIAYPVMWTIYPIKKGAVPFLTRGVHEYIHLVVVVKAYVRCACHLCIQLLTGLFPHRADANCQLQRLFKKPRFPSAAETGPSASETKLCSSAKASVRCATGCGRSAIGPCRILRRRCATRTTSKSSVTRRQRNSRSSSTSQREHFFAFD
jgi:hypothetical protein